MIGSTLTSRARVGALVLALLVVPACSSDSDSSPGPDASAGPVVLAPDAGELTITPERGKAVKLAQVAGECVSLDASGAPIPGGGSKDDPLSPGDPSSTRSCTFQPPATPVELKLAPGRAKLAAPETKSFVLSAISQPGPRPAGSAPAPTSSASPAPAPAPVSTITLDGDELVFDQAPPGRYTIMLTGSSGGVWQFDLVVSKA